MPQPQRAAALHRRRRRYQGRTRTAAAPSPVARQHRVCFPSLHGERQPWSESAIAENSFQALANAATRSPSAHARPRTLRADSSRAPPPVLQFASRATHLQDRASFGHRVAGIATIARATILIGCGAGASTCSSFIATSPAATSRRRDFAPWTYRSQANRESLSSTMNAPCAIAGCGSSSIATRRDYSSSRGSVPHRQAFL